MARVTVEDCVVQVPNRFELVLVAAHRARSLASGAELKVERDRDKNPVVALREIAECKLDLDGLHESLVKGMQKRLEPDRPEEEVMDLMAGEQQNWISDSLRDDAGDEDGADDLVEEDEADLELADEGAALKGPAGFEDVDVQD